MMIGARRPPADDLAAILAEQHAALRAADFDALPNLTARLADALGRLDRSGATVSGDALAQLRADAAHATRLIRAAQAGVARARQVLSPPVPEALGTYDASGRRQTGQSAPGRTLARG